MDHKNQPSEAMEKSWAAVVRDGKPEIRPKTATRVRDPREVVIVDIPYEEKEDTMKAVYDNVLSRFLDVIPKPQFRAFRVRDGWRGHPAPMIVQFQTDHRRTAFKTRRLVLQNRFRLKGRIFPADLSTDHKATETQEEEVVRDGKTEIRPNTTTRTRDSGGLVIIGIPYEKNEDTANVVYYNVLIRFVDVIPLSQFRAFRLGHTVETRWRRYPAPIMVQFQADHLRTALESRRLVMQNKSRLKGRLEGRIFAADPSTDDKATETEEEEVTVFMDLPYNLVEDIIARLPFPAIFKARGLSKLWRVRFSSIADLDDEVERELAISFQKLVGEYSRSWKSLLWPVVCDGVGSHSSYDRSSLKWQQLPFLSFLPDRLHPKSQRLQIDGALWLWWAAEEHQLIVVNVFTRTWKLLPPHPGALKLPPIGFGGRRLTWGCLGENLVMSHTSSDYKVLLFSATYHSQAPRSYDFHVYDSKSDAWTTCKRFLIPNYFITATSKEYLNGVLYILEDCIDIRQNLLALDLEKGSVEQFQLPSLREPNAFGHELNSDCKHDFEVCLEDCCCRTLVVCNGKLLIVAQHSNPISGCKKTIYTLSVHEIDFRSRLLSEVARSSEGNKMWNLLGAVSDGKSILFRTCKMGGPSMLEYDLAKKKWRSFPIARGAPYGRNFYLCLPFCDRRSDPFQPGLNTFAVV